MPLSVDRDLATPPRDLAVDAHHRRHALAAELEPVRDEVLDQLAHPQRIAVHGRQLADLDGRRRSPRSRRRGRRPPRARPRRGRTSSDGRGCVAMRENASRSSISACIRSGGVAHALEVVAALVGEALVLLALELLGERLHLAQRLLEVVRGDRGEPLELLVRARELAARAARAPVGDARARRSRSRAGRCVRGPRRPRAAGEPRARTSGGEPNATKSIHGTHLREPLTEAKSSSFGAVGTTRQGAPSTACWRRSSCRRRTTRGRRRRCRRAGRARRSWRAGWQASCGAGDHEFRRRRAGRPDRRRRSGPARGIRRGTRRSAGLSPLTSTRRPKRVRNAWTNSM